MPGAGDFQRREARVIELGFLQSEQGRLIGGEPVDQARGSLMLSELTFQVAIFIGVVTSRIIASETYACAKTSSCRPQCDIPIM
jgi:hypothetical protein